MAPHHSLGLDVTRVWDDSTGPSGSVALEDQYGLACLTRSQSSAQPLVVTEDTDINTDPGCYSAIDRDIRPPPSPSSSPGPDVIMLPSGSTNYSDQHGHGSSIALGHQNGYRWYPILQATPWPWWQHRSWTSTWTLAVREPDMAVGSSPGPDITLVPGGKEAANISSFLTALPLQTCLLLYHMNHSASLSLPFLHHILAHHLDTQPPSAYMRMLQVAQATRTQAALLVRQGF